MNRRMKEPFYSIMYRASMGYNEGWSQADTELFERFAEAIVNECRKVIVDFDGVEDFEFMMNPRTERWSCWCELRDHFGMEDDEDGVPL